MMQDELIGFTLFCISIGDVPGGTLIGAGNGSIDMLVSLLEAIAEVEDAQLVVKEDVCGSENFEGAARTKAAAGTEEDRSRIADVAKSGFIIVSQAFKSLKGIIHERC
mmetsp:Transcript_6179/g.7199  ORF Transcript_6179/g.7199 Transcript_6179/m.7199 type:complete len:108 (+) Transcript_6179:914-1237(+)